MFVCELIFPRLCFESDFKSERNCFISAFAEDAADVCVPVLLEVVEYCFVSALFDCVGSVGELGSLISNFLVVVDDWFMEEGRDLGLDGEVVSIAVLTSCEG